MNATKPAPPTKPVILLIEDDPLLLKMYSTKFTKEGFVVFTAADGLVGLKMAIEKKPAFIILDIMMPKLSGLDLLSRLREDAHGKTVPVIVLTNLPQQLEAQRALKLGAKEFLVKADFTPAQVVEKVKAHLRV